ncbi:type 1 glutamine amidotransferase domain-containing protein [Micromonospora sp. NPDC049559]|uniref:type 1 glutamine amidotransferase domain-containing protein n=1 Tax=Micromonospora sp. NPDC049559 TaxID=3155923 RepID=UPI003441044F
MSAEAPLAGTTVAFLATDGVEEVEYLQPRAAVERAGGLVELVSTRMEPIRSVNGDLTPAGSYEVDRTVDQADPDGYDALVLPGGTVNPDRLRMDADAMRFVNSFFLDEKPVAAICHGPWSLVQTDVVRGRTLTSYPSLRADVTNAGGTWVDEPVHVESGLVTSRSPADLPAFCAKLVELFAQGRESGGMLPG